MMKVHRALPVVNRLPRSEMKKLGVSGRGKIRSRRLAYCLSTPCVEGCTGTNLDLPNFVRRTVSIPSVRSTSSRSRAMGSLIRMPVTESNPKRVEYVVARRPIGEDSSVAAWMSRAISSFLYIYGALRCRRCGSIPSGGISVRGSAELR